jgi:hypothetical protein
MARLTIPVESPGRDRGVESQDERSVKESNTAVREESGMPLESHTKVSYFNKKGLGLHRRYLTRGKRS